MYACWYVQLKYCSRSLSQMCVAVLQSSIIAESNSWLDAGAWLEMAGVPCT